MLGYFYFPVFSLLVALAIIPAAHAASAQYSALSQSLVSRADGALAAKQPEKADNLLNLALTADPSNAAAFIAKGQAQKQMGNAEEGLRLLEIGLQIEPANRRVLLLHGRFAVDLGEFEKAEQSLGQLKRLCGDDCVGASQLADHIDTAKFEQKEESAQKKHKNRAN